jgi:hypothetical protein
MLIPREKNTVTLYCFSPAVMLATFIIEFGLAIYVFAKSRITHSDYGIVAILVFLGTFQLAEYMICRGTDTLLWTRLGLFSITFLPVIGYYLISKIRSRYSVAKLGIILAIALACFIVLYPPAVTGGVCAGNYVILNVKPAIYQFFGYYYYGFLLLGIWDALRGITENKESKNTKKALAWLIIGYLSFILPLTLVYIFLAGARQGIASIMCGFAIVFAFILTFKIAPIYHDAVKNAKHKKTLTK